MFVYYCGTTFKEVISCFKIKKKDASLITKVLYGEGYTEKALCYVAAITEEKLSQYIGDSRFASIFINEVRKRAYKRNDPRWNQKMKF